MKLKILILFIFVAFSTPTEAQFFKKLKDRVSKTVEETVSKKIEKKAKSETEAAMDSLFEGNGQQSNKKSSSRKSLGEAESYSDLDMEGMPDFMENLNFSKMMEMSEGLSAVKTASSYTFTTHLTIELSAPNEKAKTELYFGDNLVMTQVEQAPEIKMIYDYNNNSLVTIDEKNKTVFGMSMDFLEATMDGVLVVDEEDDTPTSYKKTGKTKNILGFRAEEYIAEVEELKMNFWFSDEVPVDTDRMLKSMDKMGAGFSSYFAAMDNQQYREGLVLEINATDKINNITTQVKVIKLVTRQNLTINTSNYQQLNSNQ